MRPALFLLLLAACSTPGETKTKGKTPHDRTPEAHQKYQEAVARGEVKIGMVKDEVRKAMGPPSRTSRTTYRKKPSVCWSYAYTDIFFDEDGFVLGWVSSTG